MACRIRIKAFIGGSGTEKQEVQARGHDKIPKVELEQGVHLYYKNYSAVGPLNIP